MENAKVPGQRRKNITDYSGLSFKRTYQEGNAIYYAAFHPEFVDDDGLDQTGRYLIVLLHYSGMFQFHVTKQNDKWVLDVERPQYLIAKVGMNRLDWISDCIISSTA